MTATHDATGQDATTQVTVHPDFTDDRFDLTSEDFYEVLGISRTATAAQIRKAYRKASMKYHPDRNGGTEEAKQLFQKVKEAYETLSDFARREFYNNTGRKKPQQAEVEGKGKELVHQVMTKCVDTASANDHPQFEVQYYDPVAEATDDLKSSLSNLKKMRNDLQRAISRLENIKKRFKKKDAEFLTTPMANILDDKIKGNKRMWSSLEVDLNIHEFALQFLREYSCMPEIKVSNFDPRGGNMSFEQLRVLFGGNALPPGWTTT